tara:strand:+ start:160 stop:423 length:264 start_codon:yes stop_codon:yes gene_type:complete
MQDPKKLEIDNFLDAQFDDIDMDDATFERECAIYWFANYWHGGQSSNLYEVLCSSDYEPSAMENGPDYPAQQYYNALENEYTTGETK